MRLCSIHGHLVGGFLIATSAPALAEVSSFHLTTMELSRDGISRVDRSLAVANCDSASPILYSASVDILAASGSGSTSREAMPLKIYFDLPRSRVVLGLDPVGLKSSGWVDGNSSTDSTDLREFGFSKLNTIRIDNIEYHGDGYVSLWYEVEGEASDGTPHSLSGLRYVNRLPSQSDCRFRLSNGDYPKLRYLLQTSRERPEFTADITFQVQGKVIGGTGVEREEAIRRILDSSRAQPAERERVQDTNLDGVVDGADLLGAR